MKDISTLTNELLESSKSVNQSMEDMSVYSKQAVEMAQRVAASSEVQNNQVESTYKVSNDLNALTKDFDHVMEKLLEDNNARTVKK